MIEVARLPHGAGFVKNLENGKPQTIVAYGTSLTQNGAWVDELRGVLHNFFPGLAKLVNSGASAMWSTWGLENLHTRVIAKMPDAILIEFSINDAFLEYKTSLEMAQHNLETMIDCALDVIPHCEIILMVMNPPIGIHLEQRPQIRKYEQIYRNVAKNRSLMLVDHSTNWQRVLLQGKSKYLEFVPDGIHPNALGCKKVITPHLLASIGLRQSETGKAGGLR